MTHENDACLRGLPEALPPGEILLWQGAPHRSSLARRVFHSRKVAIYFAALMAWAAAAALADGRPYGEAAAAAAWLVPPMLAALGVLNLLAWLTVRTTTYTVTNRRVVFAYGIALPMAVNIPFAEIETAALRQHGDGTGDIPLTLVKGLRIGYATWWPHARPWRVSKPEPMFRCVPDAARVAALLGDALAATAQPAASNGPKRAAAPDLTPFVAAA